MNNSEYSFLKINGNGNAWPVYIGDTSKYYQLDSDSIIANASYSILEASDRIATPENTSWEILIDGGHGLVQYMLENFNRLPEVIVITHPHSDHILALEYIIQSYYRKYNKEKRIPVYTSKECWKQFIVSFPHSESTCEFREVTYGIEMNIPEAGNTTIEALPVYHGQSATGACMYIIKTASAKVVFTGDVLFPLLREEDFAKVENADFLVPDCNNRFPYPKSNHWSMVNNNSEHLKSFIVKDNASVLIAPHVSIDTSTENHQYLSEFIRDFIHKKCEFYDNVLAFSKRILPKRIGISHYSGNEDVKYYNEKKLSRDELQAWLLKEFSVLNETKIELLKTGKIYSL